MLFEFYEIQKLPVAVIDNYYSKIAYEKIWQEICFLNNHPDKFKNPDDTGSAFRTENNKVHLLKQNKAIAVDYVYKDRSMSDILTETRLIFTPEVVNTLSNHHKMFDYIKYANADGTLLNYYETSDYYEPHYDIATFTVLTFLYKEPKKFTGGDLVIENELTIECKSNRTAIFPSVLLHAVEPVDIGDNLTGGNYGRYSIAQMISVNVK